MTIPISSGKGYASEWEMGYIYPFGNELSYCAMKHWVQVNTTPKTYATSQFGIDESELYSYSNSIPFEVKKFSTATGTELQVYQLSNGKKKKTMTTTDSLFWEDFKCKWNTAYKYRVRAYYTNDSNGKTYYGAWSSYRYFAKPSVTFKYLMDKVSDGIKITLKKGNGIVKYKVQISTKETSGYKTVKTFKVGKKSKYTYTIKKYKGKKLKTEKDYYVRIVPVLKGNKKNDINGETQSFWFITPM